VTVQPWHDVPAEVAGALREAGVDSEGVADWWVGFNRHLDRRRPCEVWGERGGKQRIRALLKRMVP
jgi:hypothetical protein